MGRKIISSKKKGLRSSVRTFLSSIRADARNPFTDSLMLGSSFQKHLNSFVQKSSQASLSSLRQASLLEKSNSEKLPPPSLSEVADFISLLKPRVMSLVVFTGFVGIFLAPGKIHWFLGLVAILCIAVGAGAAGALNMWYDHDIDCLMKRTQNRPLPRGRVQPEEALALGVILSFGSILTISLCLNGIAGALLAFTIGFYFFIYTIWLKRRTSQNIVIGGAAGALPPVIGWAAVTNNISLMPFILFLIIFMWTPGHFWALALGRADDYAKAHVPMLPVTHGLKTTRRYIFIYNVLLVPLTFLPYLLKDLGTFYLYMTIPLNIGLIGLSLKVFFSSNLKFSNQLFGYSIFYLFLLFLSMVIDPLVYRMF